MNRFNLFLIFLFILAAALAACGGDDGSADNTSALSDAASRGEALYKQTSIGSASAPGCITCHSLEPDVTLVGPSHAGIGAAAETRAAGQSAEAYLRESITEPDAIVTEGFSPGVMYQNYDKDLTQQEIDDLVAFLLTLK
jgi:cytochrome c551/c552